MRSSDRDPDRSVGTPMSSSYRDPDHSVGAQIMSYVYILKNNENRYYIGSTMDLQKRLKHHIGGYTPSTKRLGEIRLVFSQKYKTLSEARKIESWLKKMKRKDYIERIIQDGYIKHS